MRTAASDSFANSGAERFREDAAWPHSGEEARFVSYPVPRVPAGVGGSQDEEVRHLGARRNADGRRTRSASRGSVSSHLFGYINVLDQSTPGKECQGCHIYFSLMKNYLSIKTTPTTWNLCLQQWLLPPVSHMFLPHKKLSSLENSSLPGLPPPKKKLLLLLCVRCWCVICLL